MEGSPEKKVRAARVITEILKQSPNTAFYYKVGDEFTPDNRPIRENTRYGDGEILFFTGPPTIHCESAVFTGDRIGWMGDMPIAYLRKLIRDSTK